jgi:hypothetical protein
MSGKHTRSSQSAGSCGRTRENGSASVAAGGGADGRVYERRLVLEKKSEEK